MGDTYRIAIVGSGPAGLSAAARAACHFQQGDEDSAYILLEAFDKPAKTIQRYQKGKHVMAEPGFLQLRSDCGFQAGKREQVLSRWQEDIERLGIHIRYGAEVTGIKGERGAFRLSLASGEVVQAANVILAIGLEGNPRKLGAPGENLPCVQYTLEDPEAYRNETIMVVGAGDSAIENALALSRHNKVVLVNRRNEFSRAKEGNLNAVLAAINDPRSALQCYYGASVKAVEAGSNGDNRVVLNTPEGEKTVLCQRIIARLGGVPPRSFVESCGIIFPNAKPDAIPELSSVYESNVPGLYVIGSLAGYPLIKQAMNQGYEVVEHIYGSTVKPADYPLLARQFGLLPYVRDVEEILQLYQRRIPMFRQLNALAFRELVLESNIWVSYGDDQAYADAEARLRTLSEGSDTSQARCKLVRAGGIIYRRGEYGTTFFTVVEGEVSVGEGRDITRQATLKAGQFFGEQSLLSGRPRDTDAMAGRDCIVIETPRRVMLKLMNSNDDIRQGIDWMFICRTLKQRFTPNLSLQQLRPIAQQLVIRQYRAGEIIFRQGDVGDCLHVLRSGTVSLLREVKGDSTVVGQLQSGDLVGEMALMGDRLRKETAVAAVACETVEINREQFLSLLQQDPSLINELQNRTSRRLSDFTALEARADVGHVIRFLMDEGLGEATNALVIAEDLCIGCDNCEKACADTHGGISRLNRSEGPSRAQLHIPVACRHCEQPHCMKDCPPNAIHRAASGEVYIDDTCIGCGNCQSNCPYGVIQLAYPAPEPVALWRRILLGNAGATDSHNPDAQKKAVKCDACKGLSGGPACVRSCPTGAAVRLGPDRLVELVERR